MKLTFNRGETQFKTKVGALFSVLMVISVCAYAMYKLVSLVQREDVSVKIDLLEGFYEDKTESTTKENELAVAFGIDTF